MTRPSWASSGVEAQTNFDRAYVDTTIDSQQAVLNLIDATLLPAVVSPALRESLYAVHRAVELHQDQARHLQASLVAQDGTHKEHP